MSSNLFNEFVQAEYDGNQARVAEALQVSPALVSRMCSGVRGVSKAVAARIDELSQGRFQKERFIWPDLAESKAPNDKAEAA